MYTAAHFYFRMVENIVCSDGLFVHEDITHTPPHDATATDVSFYTKIETKTPTRWASLAVVHELLIMLPQGIIQN